MGVEKHGVVICDIALCTTLRRTSDVTDANQRVAEASIPGSGRGHNGLGTVDEVVCGGCRYKCDLGYMGSGRLAHGGPDRASVLSAVSRELLRVRH